MVRASTEDRTTRLGEPKPVAWAVELLDEMAEAGVNMGREFDVARRRRKAQRSIEVLTCSSVVTAVVGHPPGHLGKGGRGAEQIGAPVEQQRSDLLLQIADDG